MAGIDETMAVAIPEAKEDVPVASAAYQGSIKIVEPAKKDGTEIAGVWGSTDILYGLGVETGDFSYLKGSPAGLEGAKRVPTRKNEGNRNSLRKAADIHYPSVVKRIARRLK